MYGSLPAPVTPGGKIGTALLGYRLKNKHKKNSMPGPRPPPERKPIPGGVMNMAGMQKGALSPRKCAVGEIGGVDDARLRLAKESTARVIILPGFGHAIPGGKIGTALLGYRCKEDTSNKSVDKSWPGPPPEKPAIPGGVMYVLSISTMVQNMTITFCIVPSHISFSLPSHISFFAGTWR